MISGMHTSTANGAFVAPGTYFRFKCAGKSSFNVLNVNKKKKKILNYK